MPPLRDHLLDAYGGFADRRHKDPSLDHAIRIDDKGPHDVYPYFCHIWARVTDDPPESLVLTLQYAPCNPDVLALVVSLGGTLRPSRNGPTITLRVGTGHTHKVAQLSRAIREVVGSGSRYPDPNWKWLCPRTADSLDRLAQVLTAYEASRTRGIATGPSPHGMTRAREVPSQ